VKEFPDHVQKVIDHFMQLPGVGPRSAFRMISHLLHMPDESLRDFGNSIADLKTHVKFCKKCFNITEDEFCLICENPIRQTNKILVVEDILDLIAFERAREYKGVYHVLGGVLSPLRGIGPEDLSINNLLSRLEDQGAELVEVIIATNPNLEGEATAMYLKNSLQKFRNIKISRIARGIPTGADIDYADDATLLQALNRREVY
jgi:recombination protein RecR